MSEQNDSIIKFGLVQLMQLDKVILGHNFYGNYLGRSLVPTREEVAILLQEANMKIKSLYASNILQLNRLDLILKTNYFDEYYFDKFFTQPKNFGRIDVTR